MSSSAISAAALEWLNTKFHAVGDACDATRLHEVFAKNSTIYFANNAPLIGIEAIKEYFAQQFAYIKSMKHVPLSVEVVGNTLYQPVRVTYTIRNDPEQMEITIPAFAMLERVPEGEEEAGKVRTANIYLDPAPVGKRIGEVIASGRDAVSG